MEDDKTPETPRKRTAKATPTDPSSPSAADAPTPAGTGRTPRLRKIPPVTFVPPDGPSQQVTSSEQVTLSEQVTSSEQVPDLTREAVEPARKSTRKVAQKAAKKAAPPPAAETPPAGDVAPAKKLTKKAAPRAAAPIKTTPAAAVAPAAPVQKIDKPAAPPMPAAPPARQAVPLAALWPAIKANPGYATELLALAAVEHLGPPAREHLTWLRDTYPTATPDGLARVAASRSVRLARTQGAVAGLLGPLAVLAGTGALLWAQTRLVLDIAALHGRNPADPERAAELLVLQRVHPDLAAARKAVTAARGAAANGSGANGSRAGEAGDLPLPLVRLAGRALTRITLARQAARLVPGAGAALTGILDGRATEQLAVRAAKFYRG